MGQLISTTSSFVKEGSTLTLTQSAVLLGAILIPLIIRDVSEHRKRTAENPAWLYVGTLKTRTHFEETGDLIYIDASIQLAQQAIAITPDGHPGMPSRLWNLGKSYTSRFERSGGIDNINQAVEALKKAVDLVPEDETTNLSLMLTDLAVALARRFDRTGEQPSDLHQAIELNRRALQVSEGRGDPNRYYMLFNLGCALLQLFSRSMDRETLTEAIRTLEQAYDILPENSTDKPALLHALGLGYHFHYFESNGDLRYLEKSIEMKKQSLKLTPRTHPNFPSCLSAIGKAMRVQFECTGNLPDIDESIKYLNQAVALSPAGHPRRPIWLYDLGVSLRDRFQSTGDDVDIAEAIAQHRRALDLIPAGHTDAPEVMSALGSSLSVRFQSGGNPNDLSEAITLLRQSVKETPDGHMHLPRRLNDLGNARYMDFKEGRDMGALDESISLKKRALELLPENNSLIPMLLDSLAISLESRGKHAENISNLSEAIAMAKRAVQQAPEGHGHLRMWLQRLGSCLSARFQHTTDPSDITQSIAAQKRAIDLTPAGHASLPGWLYNLGNTYLAKAMSPHGTQDDFQTSIHYFQDACRRNIGPPYWRLAPAITCARTLERISCNGSSVLEAYDTAIGLLALVAGMQHTLRDRYTELQKLPKSLAHEAAAAAFAHGRPEKALEWLEQGRCLVWHQLSNLRTPLDDLRARDTELVARFAEVSRRLENTSSTRETSRINLSSAEKMSAEDQARDHLSLAREWETLLASIRAIPDFEGFLLPPRCPNLMSHLPPTGYVVVINVYGRRCDAIVLSSGKQEPMHIPLPEFTLQKAEAYRSRMQTSVDKHLRMRDVGSEGDTEMGRGARPMKGVSRKSDVQTVLEVLWKEVVYPIITALKLSKVDPSTGKTLPRIWWCPTGALSFLPLHAAGIYGDQDCERLMNYAMSSYTPTVTALTQRVKQTRPIEKRSSGLFLTSQPNAPAVPKIPGTTTEVRSITNMALGRRISALCVEGDRVSPDECLRYMASFSSVHLACHASQNADNPLASRFLFHRGSLDLNTIIQKNLKNADLAFLSACQTSAGAERLPDEAVHLAAGMLAAGYQRVVATMWSIKDGYAPDVARDFYEHLWGQNTKDVGEKGGLDGSGSAEALHYAVGRLRDKLGDTDQDLLAWVPYVHFGY